MKSKEKANYPKFSLEQIDELEFVLVICKPDAENTLRERIMELGGRVLLSEQGEGVSKFKKMELLGISPTKNSLILALCKKGEGKNLLIALDTEYNFKTVGSGLGLVTSVDGYLGAKGLFVE